MLQRYVIFRLLLIIVVSVCLYACSTDNQRTASTPQQKNAPTPQGPVSDGDAPIDSNAINGAWVGEMYDVRGYRVSLQINLTNTKGKLSGEMTVTVHDEEHSDMYKSLVNGSISSDTVAMRLADPKDTTRLATIVGKLALVSKINYGGSQVFYRYKMYGMYDSLPGIKDLKGGVWMVRPAQRSDNMPRYD